MKTVCGMADGLNLCCAALDADEMHATRMRLDYILGNELASRMMRVRSAAVVTKDTDMLSDHYPIECQIDVELPGLAKGMQAASH